MGFKSIIVSPVIRPDQDYHRRELWSLKQQIRSQFKKYGTTSCTYLLRNSESSFHGYRDNYAIVDFKKRECAAKALTAVENGEISINRLTITATSIELTYCPINTLPDCCLLAIFKNLSTYERLKLSSVCKRWSEVSRFLWRTTTKIDLRNNSRVNQNKKYIMNSGSHLRDIYCYDNHGLKIIGDNCKNLENVAIEFRKYTTRNGLDYPCIKYHSQTLENFSNLTRLMLKIRTSQYAFFSFLQNLPSTMIEIHLLNGFPDVDVFSLQWSDRDPALKNFSNLREIYGRKSLDFTRFTNLRALTLKRYHFTEDSLIGLETLEKLTCLCLDNSKLSQIHSEQLKLLRNLERLSLRRVTMKYEDIAVILMNNPMLKYLALPKMANEMLNERAWQSALELRHLKVLSWVDIENKIRETGSSTTVEYVELHNVTLSDRRTTQLLDNFPMLKCLKKTGTYYSNYSTSTIAFFIERRVDKSPFKYYHDPVRMTLNPFGSENFTPSEVVSAEDGRLFRCNEWDGWYIEDSPDIRALRKPLDEAPMEPMTTISLMLEKLPDNCLKRIFYHLPLDDKLTAADVCRRWKKLLGENIEKCRKLDVRELSSHENMKKCIAQYGKYLHDIYIYKSCDLSTIKTHCPNVTDLKVDFTMKECKCKRRWRKEGYNFFRLEPMLMEFKNLRRVMLKDAPIFQTNLLQYLPQCMEEIHVFNRCPMWFVKKMQAIAISPHATLDVSRYPKLRALTLVHTERTERESSSPSIKIFGVEKLTELIYLKVSGVIISEDSIDQLKSIRNLEYLSVRLPAVPALNVRSVIEANVDLQYLEITGEIENIPLEVFQQVFTLQRLKVLRLVDDNIHDAAEIVRGVPLDPSFLIHMPQLEYLDCEGFSTLSEEFFLQLIGTSPKLRMLNVPVTNVNFVEELVAVAESNLIARGRRNGKIKAFVGARGFKFCKNFRVHADGVVIDKALPIRYRRAVQTDHWEMWSTYNGRSNIPGLLTQLEDIFSLKGIE
ncbi:uncharacterized protein LOC135169346 [Diachasmimorpha longicaudata]|uniref:uncharacterized protein LOC135169346 n=1 Tax=Diachasmimorpha longicaudata TaxID=58733 RepID=UPI0030B87B0B